MDEDLQSASNSASELSEKPAHKPSPAHAPKRSRKGLYISIIIVFAVLVAGLVLWMFVLNKQKDSTTKTTTPSAIKTAPELKQDIPDATLSETYKSTPLSIAFKYPKTWKTSEAGGGIRVESPQFSYPASNLGSVDGIFRIYIRQGARKVDGAYIGAGLAIKPSEKLIYTQPAVGQRTDTWLSSFGDNSIDVFTFFLIAANFQLKNGDTLGPDYGREPDTYIVVGGYTSTSAVDDLAMTSVALDYYATTNAYKQALQIIGSIQLK